MATLTLMLTAIQIELKIDIDEKEGSAVMDFTGTGCEIRGNLNSPESVVHSAIIYCMRSMLDTDIPLNAGCLVPLKSTFPRDFPQADVQHLVQLTSPKGRCSHRLRQLRSVVGTC